MEKMTSPAGNRTPVSRVTGGDTHHYTTEDFGVQHDHFRVYKCYSGNTFLSQNKI